MAAKTAYPRTRNIYDPHSASPYRLSRSRLENFVNCPRCFYLDRRLGIEPPSIPAYTLNSAVDELLKNEFDIYRVRQEIHPLMKQYGLDLVPLRHPMINEWREVFRGISFHHQPTNIVLFGAVDDLWVNPGGEFFVVDYKSTCSEGPISLDSEYRQAYKRQMEIYQWLFIQNGFSVSATGYFVYCNATKRRPDFGGKLIFDQVILPYKGDSRWVSGVLEKAWECLQSPKLPPPTAGCEACGYLKAAHLASGDEPVKPEMPLQPELF